MVWDEISLDGGAIVPRGLYVVRPLMEGGKNDGAQLTREGGAAIRLTQAQFEKLDGIPHFERR